MTTAVLIFTFSPVQSFIAEARRAADLFVGSTILSELAKAAAQAIGVNNLVYPASLNSDVPNVIVARVPAGNARSVATQAEQALRSRWNRIAESARSKLAHWGFADDAFNSIWKRQTDHLWEVYWAAAEETAGYAEAYERARAALDAAKRSRFFDRCDEPGIKDTLSGQREALHPAGQASYSAVRGFWQRIAQYPRVGPSRLRPEGRERLDAIGATKRFCDLADEQQFPSVSTVAALDFIERAKAKALAQLHAYRDAVEKLLGSYSYRSRQDTDWPFDGDLLFEEGLTKDRLEESYGLTNPDAQALADARTALKALHKAADGRPSAYYALLVLDGDGMGKRIGECLKKSDPPAAHRQLSQSLVDFAGRTQGIFQDAPGCLIYNGGDDVLAFLPLGWALEKAEALARAFTAVAAGAPVAGTISAGIAFSHHQHPLDAALRAARAAESAAKRVNGKAAVCITALKRSGEQVTAATRWDDLAALKSLVAGMQSGELASRFVTDAVLTLEAIPAGQPAMLKAELRRQARRHGAEAWVKSGQADQLADQLADWAGRLPDRIDDLRRWLGIARFMVRESQEEAA